MSRDRFSTNSRFISLSATSSGISSIREAVSTAINEAKSGRKTIVFMDEIHRFNKLQQDIFLPHVEAGTFVLIGATTENPSFSLNSALLSRCRVFCLQKLSTEDILQILKKGVESLEGKIASKKDKVIGARFRIQKEVLDWLAEICNGDARIAISSLEFSVKSKVHENLDQYGNSQIPEIDLRDIKSNLEKVYSLPERKYNQNYEYVVAMHKCIKDGHTNGALYWLARLMAAKEDPVYIGKRLIRIATEEVGLADPDALG